MSTSRWHIKQRELRTAVHGHTKHQAAARHCPTCGCIPCANSGFCALCREADRKRAALPKHDSCLPSNWDQMSVGELWDRLNDPRRWPTPRPATIERLRRCDDGARGEINRRIAALAG